MTRDLHDYCEAVTLRDGRSLLVRAIRPSDKAQVLQLFRRLSAESIRHRAFAAKTTLTAAELAYLTEVDFVHHVALAAVERDGDSGDELMVAVGRYVSSRKHPDEAEVAFTVADDRQGLGLGTLLLEQLSTVARAAGIERFRADVMGDNAAMMDVFVRSGFAVERAIDAGVFNVVFSIDATAAFVEASTARARAAAKQSVDVFFAPRSVAVVGVSHTEGGIGRAILKNLVDCGFAGPVLPIHPEASEIAGLRAYRSVRDVPGGVDLAVIAVPAPKVESVLHDCAAAHVRGVVVISAGFAETGESGRATEERLRRLVRGSGMRMVGPNCMGVLNRTPQVSLNATFAPSWPPAGNVSMLSQSGALGIALLDHAARLNLGLASFVSVGNKGDVSGNDLLSYWADDPDTKVIALYLESVGNPRKFARIAPAVAQKKPIVAVKSGRSAAGTRAAASHSAALASLDVGVDALFEQAGVIRTTTLEEMLDVAALLSTQPLPRGRRVGVVTNAGGPGILLADACEAHGLELPSLTLATIERLRAVLPPAAGLANPIDMIASATPDQYAQAIEIVSADPNVDALVVIYIPPLVTKPEEVAAAIAAAAGRVPADKPVATVFMSSKGAPPLLSTGPRGKLPSYSFPENAALALAAASRYARWRERPRGEILELAPERASGIRARVRKLVAENTGPFWVGPSDLANLLERAGIALAPTAVVPPEPDAAAAAARGLGFPVVAKLSARGLVHKSDVGGVLLGLESADAVREAVPELRRRAERAGRMLDGVILQRQIDGGVEAIVGVTTDPSFGPLLVAGLGGVQVELLRDVAIRLTPVSDLDAAAMLDGLRSKALLEGFRDAPPVDRGALIGFIQRVSGLVDVIPELLELELNPVKVLVRGLGAIAVDARMRLAGQKAG